MDTSIMYLDRKNLWAHFELLPEPVIARPIVTPTPHRGMTLAFDCGDLGRIVLTEDGKPCLYAHLDAIWEEIEDAPNVDISRLEVDLSGYAPN